MSRTYGNERNSSQSTNSFQPIASFLQTRPFAPLQTDLDEDAPRRPSGYTENFLEKIINQRSTESSDTPVQAKPMNRLRRPLQDKRVSMIQSKLSIGEPNDKYEQEADTTASRVVQQINSQTQDQSVQKQESMEEDSNLQVKPISSIQRDESMEEEDEELQTKSLVQRRENLDGGEASADLESSIQSVRGSGQSLDPSLQTKMGEAMGADFSGVKVHTDSQSDQLNKSIQAKAFTTGQDVFFRQGAYEPSSRGGQELIAHELTHVVQQNGNSVQKKTEANKIQRNSVKDKIAFFESWAKDNQKTSGVSPVSGGSGGDKSIATLDPTVVPKSNKDVVKYFLLKERSDDYIDEEKDSAKFVFEKVFGMKKEDFLSLPKPTAEKKLQAIGWTKEEIEEFLKNQKTNVKYLETEESRTDYELQGGSTLTQGTPPQPFDTSAMYAHGFGKGHGIYVMSPNGQLYAHAHKIGKFHHSTFLAGMPTAAAGTMKVTNGKLEAISCKTGHYGAGKEQLYQVLMELKDRSISLSGVGVFDFAAKKYPGEEGDAEGFLRANKTVIEPKIVKAEENKKKAEEKQQKQQKLEEDLIKYSGGDPVNALKAKGIRLYNESDPTDWVVFSEDGTSWSGVNLETQVKLLKNEISIDDLR
jgi:Domain of unknown function (DUF4157)